MQNSTDLLQLLETATPVGLRHVLHRLGDVGRETDMRTALVGGVTRDLYRTAASQLHPEQLHSSIIDYDVCVEGSGITYAYELVRRLPGQLVVNEAFGTATLETTDGCRIDVASARTEYYESPGMLPIVATAGATIIEDLSRRDFTMNAIAIDLSHDRGCLIDPLGGAGDIRDKFVRVIHPVSFLDDPTRIFRALRYAIRLDYNLEPVTQTLLSNAVTESVMDFLTPERIRYEFECIGNEKRWAEVWGVCDLIGVTSSLTAGLSGVSGTWELEDASALDIAIRSQQELIAAEEIPAWLVRTAWVLIDAPGEPESVAQRIGISGRQLRMVVASHELVHRIVRDIDPESTPSAVCQLMEQYPRKAAVLALFLLAPQTNEQVAVRKLVLRYINEFNAVRSEMTGTDLLKLGFRPGPLLGKVRDQLRYLRLDGVINTVEDEINYAEKFLKPGMDTEDFPDEL